MTVKRLIKKNQVIVAALALMIAAAGYLNYSGKLFSDKDDTKTAQQALLPPSLKERKQLIFPVLTICRLFITPRLLILATKPMYLQLCKQTIALQFHPRQG